jgi:mRNA interferase RelE/StbE
MTYRLTFSERGRKQWNNLDTTVRSQFQTVLARRIEEPHIPSARLRGRWPRPRYKIKLNSAGYRLVYEVRDDQILIVVIAIGRRDRIYDEI